MRERSQAFEDSDHGAGDALSAANDIVHQPEARTPVGMRITYSAAAAVLLRLQGIELRGWSTSTAPGA